MQVLITLAGSAKTWSFSSGVVRVGRDVACEVHLPEEDYSMVSRNHVTLTLLGDKVRFADLGSANGILHNGQAQRSGDLQDRDVLQLGPSGPKLSFRITTSAPTGLPTQRPPVAGKEQSTVLASPAVRDEPATELAQPDGTVLAGQMPANSAMPKFGLAMTPPPEKLAPAAKAQKETTVPSSVSADLLAGMEKKLKALYTLTLALLGLIAVLVGLALYESAQIEKNRQQLLEIEAQADDQLQKMAPELKNRLDTFDKQVNSVDSRMQAAQDQFEQRLKTEIPSLMDAYIAQKTKEVETKGLKGLSH
jgi:pSer/pThr/pTyr-binding forkhead associated (FHA) protein